MVKFRVRNLTEMSHGLGSDVVLSSLYTDASVYVEGLKMERRWLAVESIL